MTAQELTGLIASYRWLAQELAEQTRIVDAPNCVHIRTEMDALFLKIVQFPAENPRISCAQIAFLVSVMGEPGWDAPSRAMLRDMTLAHVQRLSKTVGKGHRGTPRENHRASGDPLGDNAGRYSLRTGNA